MQHIKMSIGRTRVHNSFQYHFMCVCVFCRICYRMTFKIPFLCFVVTESGALAFYQIPISFASYNLVIYLKYECGEYEWDGNTLMQIERNRDREGQFKFKMLNDKPLKDIYDIYFLSFLISSIHYYHYVVRREFWSMIIISGVFVCMLFFFTYRVFYFSIFSLIFIWYIFCVTWF